MKTFAWVILLLATLLARDSFGAAATNNLSAALQQGLFEEQANNNLDAAIQAYKAVVQQFDRDRKLAATAIYRLGECYRKQGKTNEAIVQYTRIAREFQDIGNVASLSQQSLAALGSKSATEPGGQASRLVTSAEEEEIRRIRSMIQNSPDLINADTGAGTPLHTAALQGQLIVARFLLENGARINARSTSHQQRTPLHLAANTGHKAMVELLLQHNADVNPRDSKGCTPLFLAAERGFGAVGQTLIEAGADVNAADNNGETPLHEAVAGGHQVFAEFLLKNEAQINARARDGDSPLHLAAGAGHAQLASMLIERGADVNAQAENGTTPLMRAVLNNHFPTAQVLLRNKADPNITQQERDNSMAPLHAAIRKSNMEMATLLLENGADPNLPEKRLEQRNISGNQESFLMSPLELAFGLKNHAEITQMVAVLLKHNADPNPPTQERDSLLIRAVAEGLERTVQLLLEKGADVNATNAPGYTALHLSLGQPVIFRRILEEDADVNAATRLGHRPLHLAAMSGLVPQAEELIRRGADVNARDKDGLTPLHYAVRIGVTDQDQGMVKTLLAANADPNVRDDDGITPLDLTKGSLPYPIDTTQIAPGVYLKKRSPYGRPGIPYGGVGIPVPILPGAPLPPGGVPSEKPSDIAELLRAHGALDVVPNLNAISVYRPGKETRAILEKGTNDWNQFTLSEAIGVAYNFLAETPEKSGGAAYQLSLVTKDSPWPFPDLANVEIRRPSGSPIRWETIKANVAEILESGDCSRDVPLKWGDVIVLPEAEHKLGEGWDGFSPETHTAFNTCWTRLVHVMIKGQRHDLTLSSRNSPGSPPPLVRPRGVYPEEPMWLKPALIRSGLLLSSSDLSRVKVTRTDAVTKEKKTYVLDCSPEKPAPGFWLRDGDVIDVPELE